VTQVEDLARERALRGLAWLKGPGRELGFDHLRIMVSTLDMASPTDCALSQASDTHDFCQAAVMTGSYKPGQMKAWQPWALEYGFIGICNCGCNEAIVSDSLNVDYDTLTRAWKQALATDIVQPDWDDWLRQMTESETA
jgi:hypothetical protein